MKKFIVVAGSPNSGKTITTNKVIKKLLGNGFQVEDYFQDKSKKEFWKKLDKNDNETTGGSVVLEKDGKRIVVISYGDTLEYLPSLFGAMDYENYDSIICCSHATKGKRIFDFFHGLIGKIDLSKTNVIPLYKNLLSGHNQQEENEQLADFIVSLL